MEMEGEVGPQVAGTVSLHQAIPKTFLDQAAMTKKRNFPWAGTDFHQLQHLPSSFVGSQGSSMNWNMKAWDWDSVMFVAKPVDDEDQSSNYKVRSSKDNEIQKPPSSNQSIEDEDADNLTLKLGDGSYPVLGFAAGRPKKRASSGSPSGNHPMCQIDDCKQDLSSAKDYYRRHKVCEVHSKTAKALVGKQIQRFCQQCSRFHPLQEFDLGKRSCRRRLAGHNRRRRKTQPADGSSRVLLSGGKEDANSGKVDLLSLLTALAHLQGNNVVKTGNDQLLPDKENHLLQILSKINPLPVGDTIGRFPLPGNLDLNVKQVPLSLEHASIVDGNKAAAHEDFLAVDSTAVAARSARFQTPGNGTEKQDSYEKGKEYPANNLNYEDQIASSKSDSYSCTPRSSSGFQQSTLNHSPDVLEHPVRPGPSVPLQLFISSSEGDSMKEMHRGRNYFPSDSSNPSIERSPSSSIVPKLFPSHSEKEIRKQGRLSAFVNNSSPVEADNNNNRWNFPLDLLQNGIGVASSLAHRSNGSGSSARIEGFSSSSGCDNSPSSSNSDKQDQTGRIIFKLFGKDPSDLPDALRLQIFNWLKHSPSEMESYIRPGCVFLAVYISMPFLSWEKLHADFRQHVVSLVQDTSSDFWRKGRFLVHINRQFASYKDGKIRLCKSWRGFNAPELIYASPLAVVNVQHFSVTLKGRNLGAAGNRIHCTYMGGYVSAEVSEDSSANPNDKFISVKFSFPGEGSMLFGRCFIEVENGLKGDSFPIIFADSDTCAELRSLEAELEQVSRVSAGYLVRDGKPSISREDILYFLNELGWLFQRRNSTGDSSDTDLTCKRFKHLLMFSVERDWTALVRRLLDILLERSLEKGVMEALMKMLSEIHLLNLAVKRRCLKMVNLLLHYQQRHGDSDSSRGYIFAPNSVGPGGITPLHLAADARGAEELVDALTNDPQDIGLSAWTSARDARGVSPYGYALMKNHRSYNSLVQRKLLDKSKGQVSIRVLNSDSLEMRDSWTSSSRQRSCARCSVAAMRRPGRLTGGRGSIGRPYIVSILLVTAVCLCVSIIYRGRPELGKIAPFMWENISSGWE